MWNVSYPCNRDDKNVAEIIFYSELNYLSTLTKSACIARGQEQGAIFVAPLHQGLTWHPFLRAGENL